MTDSSTKFMNQLEEMGGGKGSAEPTGDEGKIQYSSHPIRKLRIGRFHFEDSVLTLDDAEDEQEFLSVINSKGFPERDRNRIKKLDLKAATALSLAARRQVGGATKQIDSSAGERPDNSPKIGIGDLLDSHKKREELGIEAALEGGREMNLAGAPDSNRETQTEPSPQPAPETPFRAEDRGQGGRASLEAFIEEKAKEVGDDSNKDVVLDGIEGKPPANEEAPQVEGANEKPAGKGFGKPLLAGTPKKD